LWEEAVFIAYYLHWPLAEILGLPHADRERVIEEIGRIHLRQAAGGGG
jgi:hypothetical protein